MSKNIFENLTNLLLNSTVKYWRTEFSRNSEVFVYNHMVMLRKEKDYNQKIEVYGYEDGWVYLFTIDALSQNELYNSFINKFDEITNYKIDTFLKNMRDKL